MKYMTITGNYIASVSNDAGIVITEEKYNEIIAAISNCPKPPSGYTYRLRADTLEWELVELPPEPDPGEEDATAEDYENALLELGVRL